MKEVKQRLGKECLTLDLVKYGLGYMDVAYGIN